VVGVASYVGVLAAVGFHLWRTRGSDSQGAWRIPVLLVAGSAYLVVWSVGGMETTLTAFLTTAGCVLLLAADESAGGDAWLAASGLCFALDILTRPDAAVFAAAAGAVSLWRRRSRSGLLRHCAAFGLPMVLVLGPYLAWQVSYYGDFVPNTYYAKMASTRSLATLWDGIRYAIRFSVTPPFLPFLTLGALAVSWRSGRVSRDALALAAIAATYVGFVVAAGGDGMVCSRLLVPLIPLFGLITYECALGWSHSGVLRVTLLAMLLISLQAVTDRVNPRVEDGASAVGTAVGFYAERNWPEGSLVALNTAGSTPYFAPRFRYLDMLGLNDKVIAHRKIGALEAPWQGMPGHFKGDGAYVLSRRPDFVILGAAMGSTAADPKFLSDVELSRDPRFASDYELVQVRLGYDGEPVADGGFLFSYYRRKP
jgi:hypothetical protein